MRNLLSVLLLALVLGTVVSCTSTPAVASNPKDMLANIDPFDVGVLSAGINNFLFTGIDKKDFTLQLEPRMNRVLVNFGMDGNKFSLYLDETARTQITSAVVQYNTAFEAKTLEKKGGKRRTAFGTTPSLVKWGLVQQHFHAQPELKLGYTFVADSPYFTVTMPQADLADDDIVSDSTVTKSPTAVFYFTRAQAALFTDMLSQEKLLALLAAKNVPASQLPDGMEKLNAPDKY